MLSWLLFLHLPRRGRPGVLAAGCTCGAFGKGQRGGGAANTPHPRAQSGDELHLNKADRCVPLDAPLPGTPCHSDKAAPSSLFSWRGGGMAPGREAGRRDAESQGQAAGAEGPRCARQPRMPDPFLDPQSAMPAGAALAHSGGGLDRGRRGHRAGRFIDLVPWKRHPDSLGPRPGRLGQVRQQGRGPCRGLTCGVRHPGWPRVSSSALCSPALPLQKPPSPPRPHTARQSSLLPTRGLGSLGRPRHTHL